MTRPPSPYYTLYTKRHLYAHTVPLYMCRILLQKQWTPGSSLSLTLFVQKDNLSVLEVSETEVSSLVKHICKCQIRPSKYHQNVPSTNFELSSQSIKAYILLNISKNHDEMSHDSLQGEAPSWLRQVKSRDAKGKSPKTDWRPLSKALN